MPRPKPRPEPEAAGEAAPQSAALSTLIGRRYTARSLRSLIPYTRNSRKHPPDQIHRLKGSLVEFGWVRPIAVGTGGVIRAGHGVVMAALELAEQGGCPRDWPDPWVAPVVDISHLTETQQQAYVLADNRLAEKGSTWDDEMLAMELGELREDGFDLDMLGWDDADLAKLLDGGGTPGLTDPDDAPAVPAVPVSRPGDVWILGKHRLACGDSTDSDTVAKALGGVTPHLMVTDPPYGVEYDPAWRNDAVQAGNGARGAPSGRAVGKVRNDDKADWREAWALFPGDVAYVWHAGLHGGTVGDSLMDAGFTLRAQIIWAKNNIAIGRGHYHWQHEPCWYAVRQGKTGHWSGDRKQSTLWEIPKPQKSETGHGTQKPVECMRRPIENNSSPGQAVYEPFSGSGTTIVACEQTGRCCHAVELDPAYVDVAVRRWEAFTGLQAVLDGDGRTFAMVAAGEPRPGLDAAPTAPPPASDGPGEGAAPGDDDRGEGPPA